MKSCPYQKADNKGLINCTKDDSHIGLCQNPCPYKATSSATKHECSTSANKRFPRIIRRKRQESSSFQPASNVLHPVIEAKGVD